MLSDYFLKYVIACFLTGATFWATASGLVYLTPVGKSESLDGGRMWDRETLLPSSLGRILTNKQGRFLGEWADVWVVLWWVSSPHIKKVSVHLHVFGLLCKCAWASVGFLLFPLIVLNTCSCRHSKSLLGVSVCPVMNWTCVFLLLTEGPR